MNSIKFKKIVIVSLLFIAIFLILYLVVKFKENMEDNEENAKNNIELVISRYNENLEWLKDPPFNKYPIKCYNKGQNEDFYKSTDMKIEKIENVGREAHTYLYHIVNNYDNLSELTIFLPGSSDMSHKKDIAKRLVNDTESNGNTVFIGNKCKINLKDDFYDFVIDGWGSSNEKNKMLNPEKNLVPSEIRPFGKWYEHNFGDKEAYYVSYYGIIGFHKNHILQHPKSYYENFIEQVNKSSNPEVGHYYERSWSAVFGPLTGAKFIEQ